VPNCLSAAEVVMKTEFTSNLMVHDLRGVEVPGTPLRCLKHQHILLAFLLQSDVKTSEPSLSINIELFSRLRMRRIAVFEALLRVEKLLCES
jgi:hypothetical protein